MAVHTALGPRMPRPWTVALVAGALLFIMLVGGSFLVPSWCLQHYNGQASMSLSVWRPLFRSNGTTAAGVANRTSYDAQMAQCMILLNASNAMSSISQATTAATVTQQKEQGMEGILHITADQQHDRQQQAAAAAQRDGKLLNQQLPEPVLFSTPREGGPAAIGVQHPLHEQAQHANRHSVRQGRKTIPFIIHQNYMSGAAALEAAAMRQQTHFRKEWWHSCKRHHAGWVHMFWDAAACEALLADRYPWFLDTFKSIDSIVKKSDAMRPFILHAYGGVYLDLDTECFGNMQAWITGPQMAMTAEESDKLNNAQMAGIAGHFLWEKYQRVIEANIKNKVKSTVAATGPVALTGIVKAELGLVEDSRAALQGQHMLSDGSSLTIYGRGQWFTPCSYSDKGCMIKVSKDKPHLRSRAVAAVAAAEAARVAQGQPLPAESGIPVMMAVQACIGVHQFSGSWTAHAGAKAGKSSQLIKKGGLTAVADFLSDEKAFVEASCRQVQQLGGSIPVCSEISAQDVAAGHCVVYSVHTLPVGWSLLGISQNDRQTKDMVKNEKLGKISQSTLRQHFAAELELADAGCSVHLIVNKPIDVTRTRLVQIADSLSTNGSISSHEYLVGPVPDPFAEPPIASLDQILEMLQHDRLTLLHLAYEDHTPGAVSVLDVLNAMYLSSAAVLSKVQLISLQLPEPQPTQYLKAYAAFQHLYQERGFVGYFHKMQMTRQKRSFQMGLLQQK